MKSREEYIEEIVNYEAGESSSQDYEDWTTEEIQELYIFYFGEIND